MCCTQASGAQSRPASTEQRHRAPGLAAHHVGTPDHTAQPVRRSRRRRAATASHTAQPSHTAHPTARVHSTLTGQAPANAFYFCFVAFRCCVVLRLVRTCFALFSNIACMYMYIAGADTYRTLAVQSHGSASNSECRFYTVPSSCQLYSHLLTHLRRCLAKDTSTHQPLMTLSHLVSHCSSTRWSAVARKVMVVVHWRRYMSQAPAPLARSFIKHSVFRDLSSVLNSVLSVIILHRLGRVMDISMYFIYTKMLLSILSRVCAQ